MFVCIGAAAIVAFGFSGSDSAGNVLTAPVTRGPIEETILATGQLEPTGLVKVGAQVSGRVEKLYVRIGQAIKAGDIIAEIDPTSQRNALQIAEVSLKVLQAQAEAEKARLRQAETAFRRQSGMLERNATSQLDYEAAQATHLASQANLGALEAQMQRARVEIDNARVALGYTRIAAPSDGTVIAIVTKQGQTLNSVQSVPTIVVLGRLDTMRAKVRISEADIGRVRPGQKLWFTVPGDLQTRHHAELREIEFAPASIGREESASSEEKAGAAVYYGGLFDVANPEGKLRPLMTVQVHIVLGRADDALIIPWSALSERQSDGSHLVSVKTPEGEIEQRAISAGYTDKIKVQVLDGLSEGEEVVLSQQAGGAEPAAASDGSEPVQ